MELADSYLNDSDYAEAMECYRGASKLAPERAEPLLGRGRVQVKHGLLLEAVETFEKALTLDPDCAEAYKGIAAIHQMLGRYEKAVDIYLQCLEKDQDNLPALVGLFQSSCGMGKFEKIIDLLKRYYYRHPDDSSIMLCLATLYVRQRNFPQAKQMLLSILSQYPTHGKAREILNEIDHFLSVKFNKGEFSHVLSNSKTG